MIGNFIGGPIGGIIPDEDVILVELAATEAQDTAAVTAELVQEVALAATEAADTAAATVELVAEAALAATEAQDTAAATVELVAEVQVGATEAQDTAAIDVAVLSVLSVQLDATEAQDTAAVTAVVGAIVELDATEAQDTASATVVTGQLVTLAATEAQDTASIAVETGRAEIKGGYWYAAPAQFAALKERIAAWNKARDLTYEEREAERLALAEQLRIAYLISIGEYPMLEGDLADAANAYVGQDLDWQNFTRQMGLVQELIALLEAIITEPARRQDEEDIMLMLMAA